MEHLVGIIEDIAFEFMKFWRDKNYGSMSQLLWSYTRTTTNKDAGKLRETYDFLSFDNFKIVNVDDEGAALTAIDVILLNGEELCVVVQS